MEQTQAAAATAATDIPDLDTIASQLLDLVTKIESLVPDFQPHDKREIARVAASAKFAHELIGAMVTCVTSVPTVPQDLFDVATAKEALRMRDLFRPVTQRMDALRQGVDFTIDSKLSDAGEDALQAYHWAKRAAHGPNGAVLQPYLDEMQRVVRRAINRSKKPKNQAPAPSPALQGQGFMAALPQQPVEDFEEEAADAGYELPESYYKVAEDEP